MQTQARPITNSIGMLKMTDKVNTPNMDTGQRWTDSPEIALITAILYQKLGGDFSISSKGKRYAGRPMPYLFEELGKSLPQLPVDHVSGQFHSESEWHSAIKLPDCMLHKLSPNDRDLIYSVSAPVAFDDRKPFDFSEHLS
jgi:hypothetical protein